MYFQYYRPQTGKQIFSLGCYALVGYQESKKFV
jgi:hypothetical protein